MLQDALDREHEDGEGPGEDSRSRTSSPAGDDDFEQYLRELHKGSSGTPVETPNARTDNDDEEEEGSAADLDDYVKDLQ